MANDCGDIFGFDLDGKLERHIKLACGVKSIVSDMDYWLYAGCDDGMVYDISSEAEPRIAYQFRELEESDTFHEPKDLSTETQTFTEITPPKPRHLVFCIDVSGSMEGERIKSVSENLRMIYEHNLKEDDTLTLITFSTEVKVIFSKYSKSNHDEEQKMRSWIFSYALINSVHGLTAYWDACTEAYSHFDVDNEFEEQWLITLTDGYDNRSKSTPEALATLAGNNRANFICIYVHSNATYRKSIEDIANQTKRGVVITVNPSATGATDGITSAFKQVAQCLSSKIMWMDVRDGFLTVSDSEGRVVAANNEGLAKWQQKSSGNFGWMVRCDFTGIYHGHSKGVTKYGVDGEFCWFTPLSQGVMFGWEDKREGILYVGSGSNVYVISSDKGNIERTLTTDNTVISTTASYGTDKTLVYAGDSQGFVYCFDGATLCWKLQTGVGSALSMQFFNSRLYIVTSTGALLCCSLEEQKITDALRGIAAAAAPSVVPEGLTVTTPMTSVGETNDPGDKVIVEIYQEFTDEQVAEIAKAIHDPSQSLISVGGREFSIEQHKNSCRCVKGDGGLLFIAQNPKTSSKYAKMASSGSQITWVKNSGRWGLVVDDEVKINGTRLLARVCDNEHNKKLFADHVGKTVQFPVNIREKGATYAIDELTPSETGEFLRVKGSITKLVS